ncbi:MAG: hypothetical protein IH899_15155, partial [Planctomycetes bacterium]|nr:hypothetical protein [Planctomycetota bacterium]
ANNPLVTDTDTATGTIRNDDAEISIDDVSLTEGDSGEKDFTFTISIVEPSALAVDVDFATANGSATSGSDYTANSGTATIAAGATSTTVTVKVQGDTMVEADETFFVNLSNPVNATIADNQGLGTIRNDDAIAANLDVNQDGAVDASTDGNLIQVVLFGLPTSNLTPFRGATSLTNEQIKQNVVDLLVQQAKHNNSTLLMVTHDESLLDKFDSVLDMVHVAHPRTTR